MKRHLDVDGVGRTEVKCDKGGVFLAAYVIRERYQSTVSIIVLHILLGCIKNNTL